jgi:hypothetical protein
MTFAAHPVGGYRAARVRGPARVAVRYPARAQLRGRRAHLYPVPGPPLGAAREIAVAAGAQLRVHSQPLKTGGEGMSR